MADESKLPEWKLKGPLSLDQFEMGVTLGTGSFGRVRFVTHKATRTHWAMKMLKKHEVIRLQQVDHMLSEKAILAVLDHPFIVKLAGTFQGACLWSVAQCCLAYAHVYQFIRLSRCADKKYLYMTLEYVVGGEFFTHLRKAGRFDNNAAKFYAAQIVLIFDYLHKQVRAPAHPLPILCSQHSRGVSTCASTGLHLQRSQA